MKKDVRNWKQEYLEVICFVIREIITNNHDK